MTLPLVFVPGWGFDPYLWHGMLTFLPREMRSSPLMLVHLWQEKAIPLPDKFIGIGHSFGVQWLLRRHHQRLAGLLSISGAACYGMKDDFACGVPPRIIGRMYHQFGQEPQKVMADFYEACQTPANALPILPGDSYPYLQEGLKRLLAWDTRKEAANASFPICSVHAAMDVITPLDACHHSMPGASHHIIESASHSLPVTHVQDCMAALTRLYHKVAV